MKKRLLSLFILGISFLIPKSVFAVSVSTSCSSQSSTTLGNTVSVTVRGNASDSVMWDLSISYDSSKLQLISGTTHYISDNFSSSTALTYKFRTIALGSAYVKVANAEVATASGESASNRSGSCNINIVKKAPEIPKSSDNNLKSLSIEGQNLSPEFNKDTLEYVVSVPSDVTKITINGSVEDNTASATGLGEFEVSEGENKFEIKVTAQNGSTKTYTVKVNVEDKNPIEVVIDNEKYTVVKRVSTLVSPSTYEEVKETINGIEVPAFKSSITNYVLVGLKNSSGEAKLYVFDKMNDTYTLYREIKTSGITLFPKESKKELKGFVKETITLNEEKINAYRYKNSKDFYVVYGVNIENNVEGFYQLDTTNNSFVKYDSPANSFKKLFGATS